MTNWADVLVVSIPSALTLAGILWLKRDQTTIKTEVKSVHTAVNSRDDTLLQAARKVARAEGRAAGMRAASDKRRAR